MTEDAFAFVTGPESVDGIHRRARHRATSSDGNACTTRASGVAALVVADEDRRDDASARRSSAYLPDHHLVDPPRAASDDPATARANARPTRCPNGATASYDVRTIIDDVVDDDLLLELRAAVRAQPRDRARPTLDGRPVGVVANQPAAAGRNARHRGVTQGRAVRRVVRHVQPPDHHVRRHARVRTGPRPRVARHDPPRRRARARVLRRPPSRAVRRACARRTAARTSSWTRAGIGNDLCVAWPAAEIAVMGAAGRGADPARQGPALDDPRHVAEEAGRTEYESAFENPYRAAERGLVDAVIEPERHSRACCATRSTCSRRSATSNQPRRHRNTRSDSSPENCMLLTDKRILVTGVLNDASIAFSRRPARAGGGRRGRAHLVRPGDEPHPTGRRAACRPSPRSSSST